MEKYLSLKLPSPLSNKVYKVVKSFELPHSSSRQIIRIFCNRYAFNPAALEQFSIKQLFKTPELWEISTSENLKRQKWLNEAYPKFKENTTRTTKRSLLRCGKCGKQTVKINAQIQIRGADEPMTIFAECLNCGKHWTQN